jgi:hypothetical protein
MAYTGPVGWDSKMYWKTVLSLKHGGDPYAEGIAEQLAFHDRAVSGVREPIPFPYIYSPLTLPLLRLLGALPGWLLGVLYVGALTVAFLLQLWTGFQMASEQERLWLALILPLIAFFPGLIVDDVILSGNVAFILYGVILAAAVPGWKRNHWFWFYIAVVVASIFKMPMLTLLAFPVLVGKRQWYPSGIAAAVGMLLFAVQSRLWPELFREYLLAIRLVFEYEHDFGYGPAGVLGKALWHMGKPQFPATTVLYLVFAGVLGLVLLMFARRVRLSGLPQGTWIPVALLGTFLLNPRFQKYDMAAITVPMLLIAWRAMRSVKGRIAARAAIATGIGCFLIANAITVAGPPWVPVELVVLGAVLVVGFRELKCPVVDT